MKKSSFLVIREKGLYAFVYHSILGNGVVYPIDHARSLNNFSEGASLETVSISQGLQKDWIDRCFLVPDDDFEKEKINTRCKHYMEQSMSGARIDLLVLNTTTTCNLRCKYCYVSTVDEIAGINNDMMTWEISRTAVENFLELVFKRNTKKVTIRFFGGEPMINWTLIERTLEFASEEAKKKGIKIEYVIVTNGTILSDRQAAILASNRVIINVSVDGFGKPHDVMRVDKAGKPTSHKVWENIKKLIKFGIPNEASAVVHRLNIESIPLLIDKLAEVGVESLDLNHTCFDKNLSYLNIDAKSKAEGFIDAWMHGQSRGVEIGGKWIRIFNRLEKGVLNYCGRMGSELKIMPNGEIWPCSGIWRSMGSYIDFEDVLSNEVYQAICRRMAGHIKDCKGCELEGMCAGGCAGNADYYLGDMFRAEIHECEFRKIVTRMMIDYILEQRNITHNGQIPSK